MSRDGDPGAAGAGGDAGPMDAADVDSADASPGVGAGDGASDAADGGAGHVTDDPLAMCSATGVTACPGAASGSACAETFCGGRLWNTGLYNSQLIPYRFLDPEARLSESDRAAVRAGAAAWSRATSGFLTFIECADCAGRFVSIVPGDGDGIENPDQLDQHVPMPVGGSGGRWAPHRIAHQWGHALGLAHTYQRADRDRHVRFDPAVWCAAGSSGLPPRCASSTATQLGIPAIASDTFGVFDGRSKMNDFRADGICGVEQPDGDSAEPTVGDASAIAELYYSQVGAWAPFQPIARSPSATAPLDYQLAPEVDPVGGPAVAEWTMRAPEVFVHGTDDRVYAVRRNPLASGAGWSDWAPVADRVDSDPAAVFGDADTLYLAARSRVDGTIALELRDHGTWGAPASLGAPAVGAASAPALATLDGDALAVFVRGGDGLIYGLDCQDARMLCAASASRADAWRALPPPPEGIFVGKPPAVWLLDGSALMVAAVSDGRIPWVIAGALDGWNAWLSIDTFDLAPDDRNPGVAVETVGNAADVGYFARDPRGLLVNNSRGTHYYPLGGVLASPPAAVGVHPGSYYRIDIVALVDDHGHPGVWWKFFDRSYQAPCNFNQTGTCAQCGCNGPGQPHCDF